MIGPLGWSFGGNRYVFGTQLRLDEVRVIAHSKGGTAHCRPLS